MAIIILLKKKGDKATEFYESSTFTQLAQRAAHCAELRVLLLISAPLLHGYNPWFSWDIITGII